MTTNATTEIAQKMSAYQQAESQINKFRSSPTEGAKGGGTRTALTLWLMSLGALFVSALLGPLVYVGLLLVVLASLACLILPFTGVPNFYRKGACPHCATEVKIVASRKDGVSCPGCRHRLMLRGNQILDVTN